MGRDLAEAYPAARAVFDEVDDGARRGALRPGLGGRRGRAHPDPQRPAGADGDLDRGDARARGRGRGGRPPPPSSPAIRSANTRRSAPPGRSASPTPRGCCACAGRRCRRRCRSGEGAMAALLGLDLAAAEAVAAEAAQGAVCEAANDNDPAQVVVSGDRAAVERAVEIAKARGRQAGAAAAGERALPLRADAARRRRDGGGARRRRHRRPGGAARRQRQGRGDARPRGDPAAARRAGDGPGPLARERAVDGRRRA